jgi:hypothetical protein
MQAKMKDAVKLIKMEAANPEKFIKVSCVSDGLILLQDG